MVVSAAVRLDCTGVRAMLGSAAAGTAAAAAAGMGCPAREGSRKPARYPTAVHSSTQQDTQVGQGKPRAAQALPKASADRSTAQAWVGLPAGLPHDDPAHPPPPTDRQQWRPPARPPRTCAAQDGIPRPQPLPLEGRAGRRPCEAKGEVLLPAELVRRNECAGGVCLPAAALAVGPSPPRPHVWDGYRRRRALCRW